MCHYVNNYMLTKDRTVFLYNPVIDDEFDKFILTHGHAPVEVCKVNDTDIINIVVGTGKQVKING